jgi:hypothetical protein
MFFTKGAHGRRNIGVGVGDVPRSRGGCGDDQEGGSSCLASTTTW